VTSDPYFAFEVPASPFVYSWRNPNAMLRHSSTATGHRANTDFSARRDLGGKLGWQHIVRSAVPRFLGLG
jgi:hypothetical protein